MRIRAESAPGSASKPSHRRLLAVGLVLALVLGFAIAVSLPDSFERVVGAALRDPGTALRGWRMRRQLPSLEIAIDLESYQRWMRVAAAQTAQGYVASEADCATVEVRGGDSPLAGTLCPTIAGPQSGNTGSPAFTLEVAVDAPWLGARRVTLAQADPTSVLGVGYLRMAAEEGLRTPHRQLLDLSVNGTGWGVCVLEATPGADVEAGSVLITFDGAALPWRAPVAPERSFAYARAVFTFPISPDGANTDGAPIARAAALLAGMASGAVPASSVVNPEELGRMVAATALWHGVAALDWRTLVLVYDPVADQLSPAPVGWAPDLMTPLPTAFVDDPVTQRAIAVWLDRYADPALVDAVLASGDLDALYVALGGAPGGLRAALRGHQTAMRETVAPSRTLFASMSEERGAIRIDLRAVLPFPVELVSLDFDGQGIVAVDPAWIQAGASAVSVADGLRVVLAARTSDEPVVAALVVPLTSLPSALPVGQGTLAMITRVWGLETSIPVIVEAVPAWGMP